jgi:hypothetical protein
MNSNSWFIEIQAIMYKYNLGDTLYWIENPMKKEQAMKVIKKEVSDYWSIYIQDMAILYQGLRYLDFNNYILLSMQCMSRCDLSVKGGTSERCYRTRRGRTDEQWYAIISPYFDGRMKMNCPYPEITNISVLAKLFFKTFISLKHLSDYRTVGL